MDENQAVYKKKFWTKKKIWWAAALAAVAVAGFFIARSQHNGSDVVTEQVKKQDIKQTVLATGQVVSGTDLRLSFRSSGTVSRVNVKEGDKVKSGAVLATLDQKDQLAALTTARGALASARANYNKVLSGASNEEVAVYQVALDNAQTTLDTTIKQQQVLVDNAYKALLNSGLAAIAGSGNAGSVTATVTGAYTGQQQGVYKISIVTTGSGLRFEVNGLETGSGPVDITPQPLGTRGLYIQFSSTSVPANNTWTVSIPNNQAATYVTNYNAYQAALETQKSSVSSAQNAVSAARANLDLKKAAARPADLEAAQAQILSAQGQVQAAESALENTIVRAPLDGTITSSNIKVGELASALAEVMVLQDVGNLHVEANVSEANIAAMRPGQEVDITFDALGIDRHFAGKVETVNPASTLVSGVVNYKVTTSVQDIPEIKPGMTANMTVLISQKPSVLAIPSRAVVESGGKKVVRVITDPNKKTYKEVEVQTGLEADGGVVEVVRGLNEGEEIVTFVKK